MKKTFLIAGLIATTLLACKNSTEPSENKSAPEKTEAPAEENEHADEAAPVQLNNGEKWQANPETTAGIQNMLALVKDLPEQMKADDCKSVKEKLLAEFNLILQKCTMTGEAHEQLHHYLLPMRDMIGSIDSGDEALCTKTLGNIKQHLEEYQNYFI